MRCIPADFNDLDAWERDQIILGPTGDARFEAYALQEGERVIAEDGTLQAEGVLGTVMVDAERWWVVVIDRATMHDTARQQNEASA